MEGTELELKIKYQTDKVADVKIMSTATVLELKEACAKVTGIPATDQKLIYKGNRIISFDR